MREMVAARGGNAGDVPHWQSADFDSIYVVKLDWGSGAPRATFKHERQGLDGRSTECPRAALPDAASAPSH